MNMYGYEVVGWRCDVNDEDELPAGREFKPEYVLFGDNRQHFKKLHKAMKAAYEYMNPSSAFSSCAGFKVVKVYEVDFVAGARRCIIDMRLPFRDPWEDVTL